MRAYAACTAITFLSRGKTAPLLSTLSYFSVCGPENGQSPFSKLFARTLRAYSARARGSFLVEKKGTKDSPKRRYPLWILLWRGTSPRELRLAKFSPPVCSASGRMSGFAPAASGSGSLRRCSDFLGSGVSKGVMLDPFSWRSRNQEVPCVLFVKLSSHKKVSAGVGCVSPHCSCRDHPTKSICGATRSTPRLLSFHEERPHLCFLRSHTFLCAVPRMDKVHSPNFSAEKLLPSGTSQAKFSPPICSASKQMSCIAPTTSGSK